MPEKPILHGRDHRVGGADPIPGLGAGITNDWVTAQVALGTVTSSTSVNGSMAGSIIYQTDGGSVYAEGSGSPVPIIMLQVGSYLVRAKATFPAGKTGYVSVGPVIAGPCTTYDWDDNQQFVAASIPDTTGGTDMGKYGGLVVFQQLCVVNNLSSATGAYLTFTNNTTGSLVGVVGFLQILRLT